MKERPDVTIVSGGYSVSNVAIDRLAGVVIAVNDSALHLESWHHCVSMDRLWTEHRLQKVWLKSMEDSPFGEIWIRSNALQNFPPEQISTITNLKSFDCDHETNDFTPALYRGPGPARLNGMSSGACALNLAYHLKPGRVFLLGFDMNRDKTGNAHWYPPYPWAGARGSTSSGKYREWAACFKNAQKSFDERGCRVFNVSPNSSIETFQKITPAEYLRLTR